MDIIFIEQLTIAASIGVYDWEKQHKQPLIFDIQLGFAITQASNSDDISDSVDYAAVCQAVELYLAARHFALVERLAEQLTQHLLTQFGVTWLRLKVCKPQAIHNAKGVGVIIERSHPNAKSTAAFC